MNTKLALEGIFDQIMGEDETIRQKGLDYVCGTLMNMRQKLFDSHPENEEFLLVLIKKVHKLIKCMADICWYVRNL